MIWIALVILLLPVESWAQTAASWWLAPYVRADGFGRVIRVCAVETLHDQLSKVGATWRTVEVANNQCVVWLDGPPEAATIMQQARFQSIQKADLATLSRDRRKPRYDRATDTVILDGPIVRGEDPATLETRSR